MDDNIKILKYILLADKPSKLIRENESFIFSVLPELLMCKGFDQNNKWHVYDVYEHILHVIDGVPKDEVLRSAALFHDIGKPLVYSEDSDGVGHFYEHYVKSREIFDEFAIANKLDKEFSSDVSKLIFYHDINIDSLDEEGLKVLSDEFSYDDIKRLFVFKRSDLLAQSSEFRYMLDVYDRQKVRLSEFKK